MKLDWAVRVRSLQGFPRGGDLGLVIPTSYGKLAAVVDGSGHGIEAYLVAQRIRKILLDHRHAALDELLNLADQTCKQTVGAAACFAQIRPDRVSLAGIGNIRARIGDRTYTSKTGMLGERMRTPEIVEYPLGHDWLVMHTDGISALPKLLPTGDADSIADRVIEGFASATDDAAILLLRKWPGA